MRGAGVQGVVGFGRGSLLLAGRVGQGGCVLWVGPICRPSAAGVELLGWADVVGEPWLCVWMG